MCAVKAASGQIDVPFPACDTAFFDLTNDRVDLEEIRDAGRIEVGAVVARYLGDGDPSIDRLRSVL